MMDCVFCDLVQGMDDEDGEATIAIIEPLNPVVPGHRIAIPRAHVRDAGDDPTITADLMYAASKFAAVMYSDYNLITSAGKHATQTVFHLHIHIVPRREGDGLTLPWTGQRKEQCQ